MIDPKIYVIAGEVLSQEVFERDFRRIVIRAPEIAKAARPGQFVMVRAKEGSDPLLPRPFSIFRARHTHRDAIEILYKVVGWGSSLVATKQRGDRVWLTGPLGQPFTVQKKGPPMWLVGGGYGVGPMVFISDVLKGSKRELKAFVGARYKSAVLGVGEFKRNRIPVFISTEDGSMGFKGRVTEVIEREIVKTGAKPVLVACGPTPMLRAVAELAMRQGLTSEVSLEETMGCGTGVCLSCVCDIKTQDGGSHQRMICRHGPVFPGNIVLWDKLRKH